MSDLRIGQRCRLVNLASAPNPDWHACEGDEVTIIGSAGCCKDFPGQYEVTRPQHVPNWALWGDHFYASRENLRPLTDPGVDAFMERIKKLGREPINETEKVTR